MKLTKQNKEFIRDYVKTAESGGQLNTEYWAKGFKEQFPKLFKDTFELKKGMWITDEDGFDVAFVVEEIGFGLQKFTGYGDSCGVWRNGGDWNKLYFTREATKEEVFGMLIKEAEKRGLTGNKWIRGLNKKVANYLFNYHTYENNKLYFGDLLIFDNGKWAETLKEITKEEAEKQLNCKIV